MNQHLARDKAVVARELIDLYRDNADSAEIVEYLSRICFSLARIFERKDKHDEVPDWDELFSFFDQKYMALAKNTREPDGSKLDAMYERIVSRIK